MPHIDYLFLFRVDGCDPATHRAVIPQPLGAATFVGVSTVDQACEVAAAALADGTADFIELCGEFGEEGCRRVIDAVGAALPVGYVTYFPEEGEKVDLLFAGRE